MYVSENDSGIEDENRRAHAGWKSHAEKNIIEAFEAIFRADARKPISSALFVSPPPRFIKPRGEGFGNTPDINATAVWILSSISLFVFLSDKLFQRIKNIFSSLFLVYSNGKITLMDFLLFFFSRLLETGGRNVIIFAIIIIYTYVK